MIPASILQVLRKLQTLGPAYISGGFLRDQLCELPHHDIDILIEYPLDSLKCVFPQLHGTERGLLFGVGRFKQNGESFEVTSIAPGSLLEHLSKKDFIMNSLYHDGDHLFDVFNAQSDIKNKIIRPLQEPIEHFATNPQCYLRAFRFISTLGFSTEPHYRDILAHNRSFFYQNTTNRIQEEGTKMVHGPFFLQCLLTLHETGLIQENPIRTAPPLPNITNTSVRCTLLASYAGKESIFEFLELFQLSKTIRERMDILLPFLEEDILPKSPILLNEVILLKKHQYAEHPEKLEAFFNKLKNKF